MMTEKGLVEFRRELRKVLFNVEDFAFESCTFQSEELAEALHCEGRRGMSVEHDGCYAGYVTFQEGWFE